MQAKYWGGLLQDTKLARKHAYLHAQMPDAL